MMADPVIYGKKEDVAPAARFTGLLEMLYVLEPCFSFFRAWFRKV